MTKDSRGQDSRVILLGKALTLSKGHFRGVDPASGEMSLISLGYFDSLQIIPLRESDWLRELWKKGIAWSGSASLETHYHPIYITALPCERAEDSFWSIETQFTFVTLLHYAADLALPKGKTFAAVARRIGELTSPPGRWERGDVTRDVYAACYRSLHLSDMVVIWKSDSLIDLLERLHRLYWDPRIGDLRTVCSFRFPRGEETVRFGEDEIPYAMVSFCVRDSAAVDTFTRLIRESCTWWPKRGGYFTTGTRDLEVVLQNVTVGQFMKCVALWFQDSEVNQWYQKAFYESSTHLGLWDGREDAERLSPSKEKSPLTEACEKLFKDFQSLREQLRTRAEAVELSWTRAVSSQLSALVDMSRICVLDGFCYLILDGVRTFLQLVRPYLEEDRQIPNALLGRIQRFVRGWGMLLDQAVRVDGQFIPSPGFSPVLYDIPVELLEFYNAFAFRCMDLLRSPEREEERRRYALFLLPKLCRRTKVQNIFHSPPPSDRLLYVDIPLDILYAPMQVLPQICHELSHYCGEKFRRREFRAAAIVAACAHMIAWHFRLGSLGAVEQIRQDLDQFVPRDRRTYKDQLLAELQAYFVHLFQSYERIRPWQEAYLRDQNWESGEETAWLQENTFHIRNIFFGRSEVIDDISRNLRVIFYLFEEGYADVSMMFLLDLSREEYLSLYWQELNWLGEPGGDAEQLSEAGRRAAYARFVQRAALVLSATRCAAAGDPAGLPPRLREFSRCITGLERGLEEEGTSLLSFTRAYPKMDGNCFPADLLLDIRDYLEECWQEMRNTFAGREELKQLRHVFGEAAREHHIGCEGYYETLDRYERFLQR